MAGDTDRLRRLVETVTCPICMDTLNQPKTLPCGHTFCMNCISGMQGDVYRSDAPLRCALCSQQFHYVVVNELPGNYAAKNVINELLHSSEGLCQVCHEDCMLAVATSRCLDCCKTLCFLCTNQHANEHNVKSLSDDKCDKHQMSLELHCFACKKDLCVQCFSEDHRQHNCDLVSKVSERLAEIAKTEQTRKTADTAQPGSGEDVVIIQQQVHGGDDISSVPDNAKHESSSGSQDSGPAPPPLPPPRDPQRTRPLPGQQPLPGPRNRPPAPPPNASQCRLADLPGPQPSTDQPSSSPARTRRPGPPVLPRRRPPPDPPSSEPQSRPLPSSVVSELRQRFDQQAARRQAAVH